MTKLPDQLFEFIWYDGTDRIETLDQLVDSWLSANETVDFSDTGDSNDGGSLGLAVELELCLGLSSRFRDLLWSFVIKAAQKATTKDQLVMLAAGSFEDLIARAGDDYILEIENLARKSRRFNYLLTGVWPQGQQDSEVWQRIEAVRAPMMPYGIDSEADLPPAD